MSRRLSWRWKFRCTFRSQVPFALLEMISWKKFFVFEMVSTPTRDLFNSFTMLLLDSYKVESEFLHLQSIVNFKKIHIEHFNEWKEGFEYLNVRGDMTSTVRLYSFSYWPNHSSKNTSSSRYESNFWVIFIFLKFQPCLELGYFHRELVTIDPHGDVFFDYYSLKINLTPHI